MRNKAQFGNLQGIIISLVVIGIILGIGFLLFDEIKGTFDATTASVVNESVPVASLKVGTYLAKNSSSVNCFDNVAVSNIFNGSTAKIINTGNYSITTYGFVKNTTGEFIDAAWKVTYTYTYGSEGCETLNTTIDAVKEIPAWLPIVIILIIVGIMLAILFKSISGRTGGGGTTAEI